VETLQVAANDIGNIQGYGTDSASRGLGVRSGLPEEGRSWSDIRAELIALKRGDYDWRAGRVPIYVYHEDDELLSVSREAYGLYFTENALGGRAFPSLVHMEEQIIQMSLGLFNAPGDAGGSFTSGGTESLFLAMKTARDRFRVLRPDVSRPRVVIPRTAHPALDKAAHYLQVDITRTGIGRNLRCDVGALCDAIDDCTMMIVGSAPCYPYGVYDSISDLAEVARSKGLWLHVDACLGGFLAPFARAEGYAIPDFDFSLEGVTSLSADLHKYGFSARGASVVLYRSAELKAFQGFQFSDWPRGTYATETFPGSRPGGAVASAWAVYQYLGLAGYRRLAHKTMDAKRRLVQGIGKIPELEVIQPTELSILLYKSVDSRVDINAVADSLGERGWFVGRSREPVAIHLALNAVHFQIISEYLRDLQTAVGQASRSGRVGTQDEMTY
jgi:sphinganine-1-phosphate aldolase